MTGGGMKNVAAMALTVALMGAVQLDVYGQ